MKTKVKKITIKESVDKYMATNNIIEGVLGIGQRMIIHEEVEAMTKQNLENESFKSVENLRKYLK